MKKYLLVILLLVSGFEVLVGYYAFTGKQLVDNMTSPEETINTEAESVSAGGELRDETPFWDLSYTLLRNLKVEFLIPSHCNKMFRGFATKPFPPPDVF